jgi:5-formyltetrahydrofolate cyclo-ligase
MEKIKFESKSHFRACARAKLSTLRNCYKRDKTIQKELISLVRVWHVKHLLIYNPLPIEADVRSVIATCRRRKCKVYVPFMEGISFKMVEWRLPLYTKPFNIKEPKNSFAVKPKIDFAVVPVIGVDGALKRIGFGKGMYDRFFDTLEKKPPILFVQREFCMTRTLLAEEHDIAADIYLTPYKTIIKRGKNGLRVISSRWSRTQRRCRIFHRQKDGSCQL